MKHPLSRDLSTAIDQLPTVAYSTDSSAVAAPESKRAVNATEAVMYRLGEDLELISTYPYN